MDMETFSNDAARMTTRELTEKYEISERTVRRWKSKTRSASTCTFPASTTEVYDNFITVKADRALVLSDIEIPCHSSEVLEQGLDLAQKFDLQVLIINGDFVALDSFSTWARSAVYKLAFREDEKEPALEILRVFLNHFPRIVLTTGNHERRLAHRMDGQITIGDFFRGIANVEYSEYAYCYLESGGRKILVCHADNYSRQPLVVPRELAAIHHMPIISGHCHHLAQGYDRSGKNWIVEGGSARSPERTHYKATRINLFPNWNLGGVFVIDGNPYLFNKENFNFYMNLD